MLSQQRHFCTFPRAFQGEHAYADAWPLFERSVAIFETILGPEHPDLAQSLNNQAELLRTKVRGDNASWAILGEMGGT